MPMTNNIDENYLNGVSPDTRIWRVCDVWHLIGDLKAGMNTLVRPKSWDDPFENFLERVIFRDHQTSATIRTDDILGWFFGQCWTDKGDETDATWRIYSPGKDRVRISTTAGNLFKSFWDQSDPYRLLKFFIGKVEYVPAAAIDAWMRGPNGATGGLMGMGGRNQVYTLLMKRDEFAHESEVRLLFRDNDHKFTGQNIYRHSAPANIFQDAVFDPRMSDSDFSAREAALRKFGFLGPITRSTLYQPPSWTVTI